VLTREPAGVALLLRAAGDRRAAKPSSTGELRRRSAATCLCRLPGDPVPAQPVPDLVFSGMAYVDRNFSNDDIGS
jgi:hypothetical protein